MVHKLFCSCMVGQSPILLLHNWHRLELAPSYHQISRILIHTSVPGLIIIVTIKNTILVSNICTQITPKGTRVIIGSMNMGYDIYVTSGVFRISKRGGQMFVLATSAHTKEGAKPSFPIFLLCQKNFFWPWPIWPRGKYATVCDTARIHTGNLFHHKHVQFL